MWGNTSNNALGKQITASNQEQFKSMNNLLTLQENHVEEFFYYHGETFLTAFEQLFEDVIERVLGQMLPKLKFIQNTTGELEVHPDALREYETITAANIQLDLQNLLQSAINSEVVMQRKMAKEQYLQSQGFNVGQQQQQQQSQLTEPQGMNPANMAMNNQSGYPIPPQGYDQYNNPYWIDPTTGQMSYTPPASGLGLGAALSKGVAWAKWLA